MGSLIGERGERVIHSIIQREGGFVDRKEDRGGPTNMGITIKTLSEHLGRQATVDEVKQLAPSVAYLIYKNMYVDMFQWINIDCVFDLVADTAVNHGRGRAALWLQRAAGVLEDGEIGPVTKEAVNRKGTAIFYNLIAIRMRAYGVLISQNHEQAVFAAGWLNRLASFLEVK